MVFRGFAALERLENNIAPEALGGLKPVGV